MQRTKRFLQGSGITTNNPNHKDLLNSTMKNSTGDQQMCDSDQLVEKKKKACRSEKWKRWSTYYLIFFTANELGAAL